MTFDRYRSILAALNTACRPETDGLNQWAAPFSPDRDTTYAAELIRRLCADIGFIPGTTIASLDDDLIRLRSANVDDVGLAHIRNPKKGYGPVQHGVVSLATGIFLGGHVAARGESTVDIVRILQRSLCGASTESQIRLPGIIHALDRGYQSEAVNQQITDVGGSIIGTHKRTGRSPFTFGKPPSQYQQAISEKGERAAYWASKRLPVNPGTLPVHAHAPAYRSGLGKVALCFTTASNAGPGYWTYVTRPTPRCNRQDNTLFSAFEDNVQLLTTTQRTPDWFLLRKFRITGSVAAKIFKVISRYNDGSVTDDAMIDPVSDPDVQTIILLLSLQQSSQQSRATLVEQPFSRDELTKKKCAELKSLCRDALLPVSGRKSHLIDRLLGASPADEPENDGSIEHARFIIDQTLLSAWFMAPFSTQDTKIGSANEANIAEHVTFFLDKHSPYHVEGLKVYGLLCRGMPVAAFSPDNVASVLNIQRGRFHAIMEYKTRTTARTVQREQALAASWGSFTTVDVSAMGFGGRLCDVVPEASHRLQLLHNISCGGVQDGFLVYASSTRIVRVVHVVVEPRVAWTYQAALEAIQKGYFTWIYGENGTVPQFNSAQLGDCIDQATIEQTLMLWKALVKLINDRGQPLPPAKHIIPTLIALWNRVKGGIDVYSRYLKNVKSKHYRLSPTAAVGLRMLMSLVYNAHQTFLLLQSHSFLTNRTLCTTYKAHQKHKQNLLSFAAFCREAAVALSQRPKAARPLSTVDGNTRQTSTSELNGTFSYKKRVHFETEKEWIDLRLSKTEAHIATRIEGALQRSCILCCRHNHDIENQGHSRLGFKTSFECNVCKLLLCRTKRWDNDQSCFDKFHADRKLPNPCKAFDRLTSTKKNENRAPPPLRSRSTTLDIPSARAPSVRLTNKKRRRSLRLQEGGSSSIRL